MDILTPVAGLAFQNRQVGSLAQDSYTHAQLEAVRRLLRDHETLRLVRYSTGGASAVTPLFSTPGQPFRLLESALDGLLINMWDRDSILQAVGELFAGKDPALGEGLSIDADAYRRALLASVHAHLRYEGRFLDIIANRRSGYELSSRPNIRRNPVGLFELPDPWGHAQNDALGAINFFLFYLVNNGHLDWSDASVTGLGEKMACLLHAYFWKIHVWEDWDLGAWEDVLAEHASSIGVVLAGLREQLDFMRKHCPAMSYRVDHDTLLLGSRGVEELIEKCEAKLKEILPNEYIRGHGGTRSVDAAMVNAFFLSALSGRPLIDDATTLQVIDRIESDLMGHIGIARYPGDQWDGRTNRPDVPRAQWTHVSPMISFVFGEMYRRTGDDTYRKRQLFHFNRGLSGINRRFHMPEAYIAYSDGNGGWIWRSDANESLAWSQAMLLVSFAGMKESIDFQAKLKSTAGDKAMSAA